MTTTVPAVVPFTDVIPIMANDGTTAVNNARDIRTQLITPLVAAGTGEGTTRPGWFCRNYDSSASQFVSGKAIQFGSAGQGVQIYPAESALTRSGQGAYLCTKETTTTLNMNPANGTNPRYDVIYIRLYDRGIGDSSGGPSNGAYYEWIEGDPAGSPTVPSIPTDCIPVAQILRPAAVNNITTANITDIRKGTALLGAVRPLLPGDALTDAGLVHGEMRSRRTPSGLISLGAPQTLVDWWSADDSKWHGTQSFEFDVRGVDGAITSGATRICAQFVIPDPGWPYKVTAGGEARLSYASGGAAAALAVMQYRVGFTVLATTHTSDLCSEGASPSGGDSNLYFPCAPGTASATFTGSQTVSKLIQNNIGKTATYNGGTEIYERFTVQIDPA